VPAVLAPQLPIPPHSLPARPPAPGTGLARAAVYRPLFDQCQALKRWAAERLVLETREDGTLHARFRYDGTTCTNMGRPLEFHYDVDLGTRQDGYPIRGQNCTPAPGETGHASMCQYITDASGLMAAIGREKPLAGRPLGEVLGWRRSEAAAGCYCDAASREHKWGLVLETIHYALHHPETYADNH